MKRRVAIAIVLLLEVLCAAGIRYWSSGSVEGAVLLDGGAQALAVDERTGRVFVVGGSVEPGKNTMVVSVLDAASGALLRTVQTSLRASGARCCWPLIAVDEPAGRAYLSSSGTDRLLLLDATSGAVRAITPDGWVSALLPAGPAGGMLTVTSWRSFDGILLLGGPGGATKASFRCPDSASMPFQDPGVAAYTPLQRLFARFRSDTAGTGLCIINHLDGSTLRRLRIGPSAATIDSLAVDERTAHVFVVSQNAESTPPNNGMVTMLDARTGHLLRRTPVRPVLSRMVIASGCVYVLDSNGYVAPGGVSILNAATGRLVRTVPLGGIAVSLTLEGERHLVVVGMQDGSSQPLDARTGLLLPRIAPDLASLTLGTDPDTHRVFTTPVADTLGAVLPPDGIGTLQVRDARTWAVLRTIPVAGALGTPGAPPMAIDSRRHRGFVVVGGCRARPGSDLAWLPDWLRSHLPWLAATTPIQVYRTCILVVDTAR